MRSKFLAGALTAATLASLIGFGSVDREPAAARAVDSLQAPGSDRPATPHGLNIPPFSARAFEAVVARIPGVRSSTLGSTDDGPDGSLSPDFLQIAWVVDDIAAAEAFFEDKLGTCPFIHLDDAPAGLNSMYRGQPGQWVADIYLGQWGNTQIELIHPESGPSIFQEWLDARGSGLQHFAVTVASFADAKTYLEANGFPLVQYFEPLGSKVGYFDLGPALGVYLEIIELNVAGEALFDLVASCVVPV